MILKQQDLTFNDTKCDFYSLRARPIFTVNYIRNVNGINVTLNAPLFGCLLLTLHHCFPVKNKNRLTPFEIGIPFNMRPRLPPSPLTASSVGFFVGMGEVTLKRSLPIPSTEFWPLVHQCMIMTRHQLRRSGIPLTMNIFTDVLANERDFDRVAQLLPEGRQSEFGFSSIGKYPFLCEYNQGDVRLRDIHVINNNSVYRNSSALSSLVRTMVNWTFRWLMKWKVKRWHNIFSIFTYV